jgi:hypothetical protein
MFGQYTYKTRDVRPNDQTAPHARGSDYLQEKS